MRFSAGAEPVPSQGVDHASYLLPAPPWTAVGRSGGSTSGHRRYGSTRRGSTSLGDHASPAGRWRPSCRSPRSCTVPILLGGPLHAEVAVCLLSTCRSVPASPKGTTVPDTVRVQPHLPRQDEMGSLEVVSTGRAFATCLDCDRSSPMRSRMIGTRYLDPGDRLTGRYDPPRPLHGPRRLGARRRAAQRRRPPRGHGNDKIF